MTKIKNIIVTLKTGEAPRAGTDDHLYVGIVGRGSGGEFNLSTLEPGDDYNLGELRIHYLGPEPDDPDDPNVMPEGAVRPFKSVYDPAVGARSGFNDPVCRDIDIELVENVYIRKVGPRLSGYDDSWQLEVVQVKLMTDSSESDSMGRSLTRYFALGEDPEHTPPDPPAEGWEDEGSVSDERDIWLGTACGDQVWLKETTPGLPE